MTKVAEPTTEASVKAFNEAKAVKTFQQSTSKFRSWNFRLQLGARVFPKIFSALQNFYPAASRCRRRRRRPRFGRESRR